MKNVIAILTNNLQIMENNEPINRREGKIEQAELEAVTAAEIRQALAILETPWPPTYSEIRFPSRR